MRNFRFGEIVELEKLLRASLDLFVDPGDAMASSSRGEYAMGSQISTQGDVYSYGILLLEMLIGKKPTNDMFKDGLNLHKFVDMAFPERVMEILDPQILQDESEEVDGNIRYEDFSKTQLRRCIISLIRIGLLCAKESPNEQPRMQDVTTKVCAAKEMLSVVEIIEEGANLPE
ncbi:receptor kinase-like protein Xa21 [Phoenix dactylifera]|uniref:Receptor kinase-like protein Xa21 n=1 Tax=Phoenix dactylifera TaxID=42345 RepID=A0A8B8JD56_PHODC|nr:receptor kinase-like protein Xa21 [Phoenix dactylifera]